MRWFVAVLFVVALALSFITQAPALVSAVPLAAAVTGFLYGVLGPISPKEVQLKGVVLRWANKLFGTEATLTVDRVKVAAAVLVLGVAVWFFNGELDKQKVELRQAQEKREQLQRRVAEITDKSLRGVWQWHYPDQGWRGNFTFEAEPGRLTFRGPVYQYKEGQVQRKIYEMESCEARISDGKDLEILNCPANDYFHPEDGRQFRRLNFYTKSGEALVNSRAFVGRLWAKDKEGKDLPRPWGFTLYKPVE